jgi:protein-S-isoprenylcysteine O-methyltransferase Ste14
MPRKAYFAFFLLLFFGIQAISLANQVAEAEPEMADALRSNGKIYIVVLTVLIVLFGLIAYLFSLDKKISKLEQDQKNK